MTIEPYEPRLVHWFGDPWPSDHLRAGVCEDDRYRIPVPVGEPCCQCGEPIEENHQGVRYAGHVDVDSEGKLFLSNATPYSHVECNLRSVTGNLTHLNGDCHHIGDCNDRSTKTFRQEALEVWSAWATKPVRGYYDEVDTSADIMRSTEDDS